MGKYFVSLFLCFVCVFALCVEVSHVPPEESENLQAGSGDIYYGSEKEKMTSFDDSMFNESEYSYNQKLCLESLSLSVATFSTNVTEYNWGENGEYGRADGIKNKLLSCGFDEIKAFFYDRSLNDSSSKAAFCVGQKSIGSNTRLVCVAVRGGNYGLEWADNFNTGTSEENYHAGFYASAAGIKKEVDKIISDKRQNEQLKLWICGFSRGGAVANILAAMYDDKKGEIPCQIYCYTFASPKTAVINSTHAHDTVYRNIFNILSPNDPVYNIPPAKWGFGRFGICVLFPDNNDMSYDGAAKVCRRVAKSYYEHTGETLVTTSGVIDSFVNLLIKSAESRDFFAENLSGAVSEFIMSKMSRCKNPRGVWEKYDPESFMEHTHGKKGLSEYQNIKKSEFFSGLKKIGIKFPDDFYMFVSLCRINGFKNCENYIFSQINAHDMGGISQISSPDMLYTGHRYEFYLSWLENAPLTLLKFVKE